MKTSLGNYHRVIAVMMAVVLFVTSWAIAPAPSLSANSETPYITMNEKKVTNIVLTENEEIELKAASTYDGAVKYRWQIRDMHQEDRWIQIARGTNQEINVSYALIGSMLDSNERTEIRCKIIYNNREDFSETVEIQVSHNVYNNLPADGIIPVNTYKKSQTHKTAVREAEEEHKTYTILINYLFGNGALAFESYGATIAKGSDFVTDVTSPTVVGYRPVYQVDGTDAEVVKLNFKNVQENITINVVYIPTIVNYSIHHHLQNLLDDDYSVQFDLITTSKGLTGDIVAEGLQLTQNELPGFSALTYERLPIAADGSTVVEIRYNRNYYLVDFDMNGGYGTEPVYTRYEATVGANNPTRHGYVFDGWELVSYGGRTPTDEEKSKYEISDKKTIMLPDANLTYRAKWITQETTYTMVFWQENANDNGYTYWGYLDKIPAMSGDFVDGSDRVKEVDGIKDVEHFTFNQEKTEKSILVEGDGSTVVNVYYTRNFYKITFKASGKSCTIPTNHMHTDACYDLICGESVHVHTDECGKNLVCNREEHAQHNADGSCLKCDIDEHVQHSAECLICGFTSEHKEHTDACLKCGKAIHSQHGTSCYADVGNAQNVFTGVPGSPVDGQVANHWLFGELICIQEKWYRYSGSTSVGNIAPTICAGIHTSHTSECYKDVIHMHEAECYKDGLHNHVDTCYRDALHTHADDCYKYTCNSSEHTHTESCKRLKCGIPENHAHSNSCNNTVKVVYGKYDANITDIWPIVDDNGITHTGYMWKSNRTSNYYAFLEKMSGYDLTLTRLSDGNYEYNWYYYLEVLEGQRTDGLTLRTDGGKTYYEYMPVKVKSDSSSLKLTYEEDYFPITGFTQRDSTVPSFSNRTAYLYYDRIVDHKLEFNNNGHVIEEKTQEGIPYGQLVTEYNFTPDYPTNLEPNAYEFDGWYTSPRCFEGTEVDWNTQTMPVGDLLLYAKWAPITHTVRVFKDATLSEQWGEDQDVAHNAFAYSPDVNVENGNYIFQGWFYMDEGKEKAFVFNGIPVLDDMDIYAKWSSHVPVQYTIHYVLKTTGETIADSTLGMAIAGNNKTFEAKAGNELYEGFRTGYYPLANSHTITMSADGAHEYTFEYVYQDKMPYLVRYINAETGAVVHEEKKITENSLSVVTETFEKVEGMMPDAYQKRLVLSADTTDQDGDGIYDANVITFYYSSNNEDAYYRIVHKVENISGDGYLEYRAEEKIGKIGEEYTVEALTITGFTFDGSLTKVNDVSTPTTGTTVTATLPKEGMLIELYYKRNSVNYTVSYLDYTSKKPIVEQEKYSGMFGGQVIAYALDLTAKGYDLVSENAKTFTLTTNEEYNIIEFFYQEQTVSLKYEIVGPSEGGSLSQYSENVSAITGKANGSRPIVKKGYEFKGWYEDAACTRSVDSSLIDAETNQLKPTKEEAEVWETTTYYAKIVALETELTIKVENTGELDTEQAYIFHIVGKKDTNTEGVDLTVTVIGDSKTTITKLPVGEYRITEMTNWSWRYQNENANQELLLEYSEEGTTITYENMREHVKWLDGNDVTTNRFQ